MKEREKKYIALWQVMQRECRRLVSRPLYLFCMVIAPSFCYVFFTTLMDSGLPKDLPAGVVDMDDSSTSRNIVRNLDAFSQTGVVAHYSNVSDARIAVQEGKIYGFFYIPKGLSAEAQSQRQPTISFYTNYSYLIAGSLLFRDMKMLGELTAGAAARTTLYAKGATEDQAMGFLQPIVIDTHPLNNPWLNYSVYLCNTLIPGVLMLLIFMVTVYSIGVEIKDRTAREWLRMSNNSIYIALAGKLLPRHTLPCTSIAMLRYSHDRYITHSPAWIKFCLFVGSHFFLHFRLLIPCYGNAPCTAGAQQPIPIASLFSNLCRPGTQRI